MSRTLAGLLAIAVLAVALTGAQAQTCGVSQAYTSGVLYWCSAFENGANMAWSGVPNQPRTIFTQQGSNNYSIPCHQSQSFSDTCSGYTFTNGSKYDPTCSNTPTNVGCSGDPFAIAPTPCQVWTPFSNLYYYAWATGLRMPSTS